MAGKAPRGNLGAGYRRMNWNFLESEEKSISDKGNTCQHVQKLVVAGIIKELH